MKDIEDLYTWNTKLQVKLGTAPALQTNHQVAGREELENESNFDKIEEVEIQVHDEEKTQQPITGGYQLTRDRIRRAIRETSKFRDFVFMAILSYNDQCSKRQAQAQAAKTLSQVTWYLIQQSTASRFRCTLLSFSFF